MVNRQDLGVRVGLGLLLMGWLGMAPAEAALRPSTQRAAVLKAAASHKAKKKAAAVPTIHLEHLTTHDSLALRPAGNRGGFGGKAMKSVSRVLRCHHTGKRHAISARLVNVLYATARHFHSQRIFVVAGYRAPAVARKKGNPKSAHKRGVACDFRLDGVRIEAIRDYLRETYHNVGVGYYPNSGFIHLDVGRSHPAYWVDYSGPGEKARYAAPAVRANSEAAGAAPSEAGPGAEPSAEGTEGTEEPGG
jgi:uncharacterized protein YcbK (DUF882 family)